VDFAKNQDILGVQVSGYVGRRADGQSTVTECDGSLDPAIDDKVLTAFNFPKDHNTLADPCR
jgi:hypothetical protein